MPQKENFKNISYKMWDLIKLSVLVNKIWYLKIHGKKYNDRQFYIICNFVYNLI